MMKRMSRTVISKVERGDPFAWAVAAPFYQAGLAGYSDAAMRGVARRHGCPYCVTEAMLDRLLLDGGKALAAAELDDQDHPIAGQLMGSQPSEMAEAARVLVRLGYDVIDVNLACPVKKIRKKARGGHLLGEPAVATAILDAVRQAAGDCPCTVKLRRGSDDSGEAEANFHEIFQAAVALGYAGATVHCRTVEQKYLGPGDWPFLRRLVHEYRGSATPLTNVNQHRLPSSDSNSELRTPNSHAIRGTRHGPRTTPPAPRDTPPDFHIAGSGDIWHAADIFRMIADTGVDFVSVARGCIGNPWIFRQAQVMVAGTIAAAPSLGQQREVLLEHFDLSVGLHGEQRAGRMMRKFGIKFARHHPDADAVKDAFIKVKTLADWHAVLDAFYAARDREQLVARSGHRASSPQRRRTEASDCPAVRWVRGGKNVAGVGHRGTLPDGRRPAAGGG